MNRSEALKVLNLSSSPSSETIKKRYRELAKKYHPDLGGDEEKFHLINRAYDTLMKNSSSSDFDVSSVNYFDLNIDSSKIRREAESVVKDVFKVIGGNVEVGNYSVTYKCPVCGREWQEESVIRVDEVVEDVCESCLNSRMRENKQP